MHVKLTNPSVTGKFAVSARLLDVMLLHFVCSDLCMWLPLVAESAMHCRVVLVRGAGGEVMMVGGVMAAVGGITVNDLGRMQMCCRGDYRGQL